MNKNDSFNIVNICATLSIINKNNFTCAPSSKFY